MRKSMCMALAMLVCHLTSVPGFGAAPNTAPAASKPASRPAGQVNPARYEKQIAEFEQADRADPPPKGAIVFIGSSTIRRWTTLQEDFPEHRVINRGFGGSHISDAVHFADRIVLPYEPAMVFLRSGGNDIHWGKPAAEVMADFKAFVEKIHARLPNTTVVFIGLNPALSRWTERQGNLELNRLAERYARKTRGVEFIDAYELAFDEAGELRPELFARDRLHFSPEGYKLLVDRVRPFLPKPASRTSGGK